MRKRNKQNRCLWRHLLASTVVALSVSPVCQAQQRGRLLESIMDKFDTNGDGRLSPEERAAMPKFGRRSEQNNSADPAQVPENLKQLYKVHRGPHAVESITSLKLAAKHRDDDLPIRVTYPKSTGSFPVIVFSHGAFGSKDAYDPIVQHWASHGYVVVQGTHGDSLSLVSAKKKLQVITSGNPFAAMQVEKYWRSRGQDANLILNSLSKLDSLHAPLRGKLNLNKIAMGGHSYGSHTTQLIGGLDLGADLKNKQVRALLLLSPPGPAANSTAANYQNIAAPLMTITGSKDETALRNQGYEDRLKTHEKIPSKQKFLLFMKDAQHSLGGVSGTAGPLSGGAANADHLACVKSATTAFWDFQLKSDTAAQSFLNSNDISQATQAASKLTR